MSLAEPAPGQAAPPRRLPLIFTGSGAEFFRIWIVNLALTLATLGVYSAWAKVRTRRYFYGNLVLDGSAFEYTADPFRILIGRLIVLALFVVYSVLGSFSQQIALAFAALILLATPFLAVRSLAFHRRNSRHRGIRFKFLGGYAGAARVYLGWPLLSVLSLGLAAPHAHAKRHAFVVGNTAYGASRFAFAWRGGDYYGLYLSAIGAILGVALLAGGVAILAGYVAVALGLEVSPDEGLEGGTFLSLVTGASLTIYLLAYAVAYAVFQAGSTNLFYGGATLPGVRLVSRLPATGLLREYAICGAGIAASLGLLIPWAQVRLARFRARHLELETADGLDHFTQSEEEAHAMGAVADEAAAAFDFDFGL